ncbi:MAG: hypothetical protein C5B50_06895 [Verrucomicrobia bacterium]|nr:MAG: hypothetical protein C5B50_06895 [Verrucomicrobiota bacterium]
MAQRAILAMTEMMERSEIRAESVKLAGPGILGSRAWMATMADLAVAVVLVEQPSAARAAAMAAAAAMAGRAALVPMAVLPVAPAARLALPIRVAGAELVAGEAMVAISERAATAACSD